MSGRKSGLAPAFYGIGRLIVFGVLLTGAAILTLIVPRLAWRRALIRRFARLGLAVLGLRVAVRGEASLPDRSCIVVANHSSYLDGVILKAVLPPRFAFVIKREAARMPVAGLLLRRIGSEFVDRFDHGNRRSDARRVVRRAAAGHSLVFFPEGTFTAQTGLGRFHIGAFVAAARAGHAVVPTVIVGARRAMPAGTIVPRPGRLAVEILAPIAPPPGPRAAERLRDAARRAILARLDEPDLMPHAIAPASLAAGS